MRVYTTLVKVIILVVLLWACWKQARFFFCSIKIISPLHLYDFLFTSYRAGPLILVILQKVSPANTYNLKQRNIFVVETWFPHLLCTIFILPFIFSFSISNQDNKILHHYIFVEQKVSALYTRIHVLVHHYSWLVQL